MVCNPEVSRTNGAKSRGAITERGKAIASRNATKHGLLAKEPPLLVTEDFTTFEGLVQSLIEHYQPENPVEHFLIQQAAMGMLKQHRLWSVEAAIANVEILKTQQANKFPEVVASPAIKLEDLDPYMEKRIPVRTLILKEKSILQGLINDLEYDKTQCKTRTETGTLKAIQDSLRENYYQENRTAEVYQYQDELDEWLTAKWDGCKKAYLVNEAGAIDHVEKLLELARKRIEEIEQILVELEEHEQAIQQSETMSKGLQNPELFNRYQREINRSLYEAIDRLEEMRKRRQNKGSMGSFRQISSK